MRMKFITSALMLAFVGGLGLTASPANAASVQSMLSNDGCTACHTESMKIVGPAFSWVAYRYQGVNHQKAVEAVAKWIISGGAGYWAKWTGGIPMPSHPSISMAQAKEIAAWILKQPPIKPPKT